MAYSKIEAEVALNAEKISEKYGYEIYDVELVKEGPNKFLRVYIDKADGVELDDCEAISRELSTYLDEVDLIAENYFLEVSSPGIERVLKQDKHFEGALGEQIKVKLYKSQDDAKEYEGILNCYDDNSITLDLPDGNIIIERKNIAKANIVFNF